MTGGSDDLVVVARQHLKVEDQSGIDIQRIHGRQGPSSFAHDVEDVVDACLLIKNTLQTPLLVLVLFTILSKPSTGHFLHLSQTLSILADKTKLSHI